MEYLDFEVEIGARSGRSYALSVLRSPTGEPRGTLLPLDRRGLEFKLLELENALLRSGATHTRRVARPDEAPVRALGVELFRALLNGEVLICYQQSQRKAREQGMGLRLKLRIQVPELAALPWEFLYDPTEEEYVCLSRRTPVVRYLESRQPLQALDLRPPLRVLGLVSSPEGMPKLDTPAEQALVEQSLGELRAAGLVELVWLPGQTWSHLQTAMWQGPWHILHFIGHGGFSAERDEGFLAFANEDGSTRLLTATELGRLLSDHDPLRLAVLNACEGARGGTRDVFSSTAATLVRRGVPAVVAMQYEISDGAAIQFGTRFYAALAHNLPVDAALAEARIGMSVATSESAEWGTPVLYTHSPDGRLFELTDGAPVVHESAKRTAPSPGGRNAAREPLNSAPEGLTNAARETLSAAQPEAHPGTPGRQLVPSQPAHRKWSRLGASPWFTVVLLVEWLAFAFLIERYSYERGKMPFQLSSRVDLGISGFQPSWMWAAAGLLSVVGFALYSSWRSRGSLSWLRVLATTGIVAIACVVAEGLTGWIKHALGVDNPRLITSALSLPILVLMLSAVLSDLAIGAVAGGLVGILYKGTGVSATALARASASGASGGAAIQWGFAFPQLLGPAWLLALLLLGWGLFPKTQSPGLEQNQATTAATR